MNRRSLWTGFLSLLLLAPARRSPAADCAERVKKIIVEQFRVPAERVTPQASLKDDLGMDSLDCVELVLAFEDEFNIAIPDAAVARIRTVADIISHLKREVRECA